MPSIAVDPNTYLVYEGQGEHGHAIWPSPVLSIATVFLGDVDTAKLPESNELNSASSVFREDSFDPVTRIRRGRLYKRRSGQVQPHNWRLQPHPGYRSDLMKAANNAGWIDRPMNGFDMWPAMRELEVRNSSALVALGTAEAFTLWRIVDVERIVTGEDLLTLRARTALGVLPELNLDAVPEKGRTKVAETLNKLSDAAYRAGPESVVELARAAAQWCVGVFLAEKMKNPDMRLKELGQLARHLQEDANQAVASLLARLHSRNKLNEQERHDTRPIVEGDAEFALAAVGMLLRELGWSKGS